MRLASTALSPLARRLGGSVARMAVAGVGASLSRSGIAVVALAIAVSATIGVSAMVGSFRAAVWMACDIKRNREHQREVMANPLQPQKREKERKEG